MRDIEDNWVARSFSMRTSTRPLRRGGRRHWRRIEADLLDHALERRELGRALGARGHMRGDFAVFVRIECAQRKRRQQFPQLLVCHASELRKVPMAFRSLVFTVPSGIPVRAAISVCVSPS